MDRQIDEEMKHKRQEAGEPPLELSGKEKEIARLASIGLTDKEIAGRLHIKPATVRTYWDRIRQKLNAANRAHAIVLAATLKRPTDTPDVIRADVLRSIPDEVIVLCTKSGKFLTWNEGVGTLLGYEESEWVGKDIGLILDKDAETKMNDELECARKQGSCQFQRWHVRKDGTRFMATNLIIAIEPPEHDAVFLKIVRAADREAAQTIPSGIRR